MQQTQPDLGLMQQGKQEKPIVVRIKPGSSSEKSVKAILPIDVVNKSIDDVVKYVLEQPDMQRGDARIADRVKAEMSKEYGIVVNTRAARGDEKATDYLTEQTSSTGLEYKELEIIIAAKQAGGLISYLR